MNLLTKINQKHKHKKMSDGYRLLDLSENTTNKANLQQHDYYTSVAYYKTSNLSTATPLKCLLYLLTFGLTVLLLVNLNFNTSIAHNHLDSNSSTTTSRLGKNNGQLLSSDITTQGSGEQTKLTVIATSSNIPKNNKINSLSYQEANTNTYNDYLRNSASGSKQALLQSDDLHFSASNENVAINTTLNSNIWWSFEYRNSSNYITISNYVRAIKSFNYDTSVTLTTQATTEFIYHSLQLCERWDGPISIAIFSPGPEMSIALTLVKYMRECLPQPLSACIKDKITWHLVYNTNYGPSISNLSFPQSYLAQKAVPLFIDEHICPKVEGPSPELSIQQFELELKKKIYGGDGKKNFRSSHKLVYPINVLRNTARLAAKTKYVMSSDIELYPSVNLVPKFINLISRKTISSEYPYVKKFVLTLPIFETKFDVESPRTKKELRKLFSLQDAIYFHKYVCDVCQNFPNRDKWLLESEAERRDELGVFEVVRRDRSLISWEPIYIGTNDEPLYDERLSWEGRRDKMSQAYQLCLDDYYMLIAENAFLVHAAGIKKIDKKDVASRYEYLRQNNIVYDSIISDLKNRYASSETVKTC